MHCTFSNEELGMATTIGKFSIWAAVAAIAVVIIALLMAGQ